MSSEVSSGGIVRSSLPVALGTALSRLTGLLRLGAMAYALGFSRLTDTYNLANNTPNIVYELILGGVLSATLVPVFVAHREHGDERATSAVITVAGLALVLLTGAGILAAPLIVHLYTFRLHGATAADQQAVATDLLRLFMPQMLFYGITALATALLNAHRRFAAPAITPVLNNLAVAGIFLALPHVARSGLSLSAARHDNGLLWLLGVGTTAGVAAMALPLWPALRRAGVRLRPVLDLHHPAVRRVLRLSGWTAGYVAANQIALWIVLVLANGQSGGVSAYQGAFMFFQLPHGLIAVSLMTTLVPELAQAVTDGDLGAFRHHFTLGLRLMTLVVAPAAAGYLVLARPVVGLLLQRGALTSGQADLTAGCLAAFAAGLVGFSLYLYALRGFYAFGDTRTPFFLNLVENGVNIVLGLALVPFFGVVGLAAAYAAAYLMAAALALTVLSRRAGGIMTGQEGLRTRRTLARIGVGSALVAVCVRLAVYGLVSGAAQPVKVGVGVAVGGAVYGVALHLMRVTEVRGLLGRLRRTGAGR